jgi:precorrin-2 dehydrogenase/sirohydrochlorin ferrochelatase
LIVGGGNVGLEKLHALLKSSPAARVTIVSETFLDDIRTIASNEKKIRLVERGFRVRDLQNKDLVILATDDKILHERIRLHARKKRVLINVADTPDLCDFYLGSVVTKGNVKIGISTNGKSPTMAKRMREYFEEVLPENTDDLLNNMQRIREKIKGDFKHKINVLNEITASWLENPHK